MAIENYYGRLIEKAEERFNDDKSEAPTYLLMKARVGYGFETNTLSPSEWSVTQSEHGIFIAHQDFLSIQDEFYQYEGVSEGFWDGDRATQAMQQYLQRFNEYRERHIGIYRNALDLLPTDMRSEIESIATAKYGELADLKTNLRKNLVVGLPWYDDNPQLWEEFLKIPEAMKKAIPPWFKIGEAGVISASRRYRKGTPGHDYFSYAYDQSQIDGTPIADRLLRTAQHEGSHGIIDGLLNYILKMEGNNAIMEGFAGALGEDRRAYKPTTISLDNFLEGKYIQNNIQEGNYVASPKFFQALFDLIQNNSGEKQKKDGVWSILSNSMLKVGLMCKDEFSSVTSQREKLETYFQRLILDLRLYQEEVGSIYEQINEAT